MKMIFRRGGGGYEDKFQDWGEGEGEGEGTKVSSVDGVRRG